MKIFGFALILAVFVAGFMIGKGFNFVEAGMAFCLIGYSGFGLFMLTTRPTKRTPERKTC